jgi:lactoylglutathione lyase
MLRVGDPERSIEFYSDVLDMRLLRCKDRPKGEFTLAFVGYGDEKDEAVIELTYNRGVEQHQLGDAHGHLAIEVDDVYQATEAARERGAKILREAGPMNTGSTMVAFIEDPDVYQIELLGKGRHGKPLPADSTAP